MAKQFRQFLSAPFKALMLRNEKKALAHHMKKGPNRAICSLKSWKYKRVWPGHAAITVDASKCIEYIELSAFYVRALKIVFESNENSSEKVWKAAMNIFYVSKNKALGKLKKYNWQRKTNESREKLMRAENKHNASARSELFQLSFLYACEWLKSIVSNHNKFNKRQEWHEPSNWLTDTIWNGKILLHHI